MHGSPSGRRWPLLPDISRSCNRKPGPRGPVFLRLAPLPIPAVVYLNGKPARLAVVFVCDPGRCATVANIWKPGPRAVGRDPWPYPPVYRTRGPGGPIRWPDPVAVGLLPGARLVALPGLNSRSCGDIPREPAPGRGRRALIASGHDSRAALPGVCEPVPAGGRGYKQRGAWRVIRGALAARLAARSVGPGPRAGVESRRAWWR